MKNKKFKLEDFDSNIGEPQKDEKGIYRIINGKKIYQIEEKTEGDIKTNEAINRFRASGFSSPSELLKSLYH